MNPEYTPQIIVSLLALGMSLSFTSELLGSEPQRDELKPGAALSLKGFSLPVQSYVLAAA